MSLGLYHTCAILDDGSLKCWGDNNYGELGIGGTTGYGGQYTTPQAVDLGTGRTAVSVSLGQYHTCALLDDGSLKCWGRNYYGELGIGGTTAYNVQYTTPQTVNLGTGRTAVSVSSGQYHTCAVLDNNSLNCWGHNDFGQLGTGDTTDRTFPTPINLYMAPIPLFGNISGFPLSFTPGKNYTITANNSYGSSNVTLYLEVVPVYDYGNNTLVLTRNQTMSTRSPIITGGSYNVSISPTLPHGLFFEPSNGSIWGTPTINQTAQTYTIAVSNLSGSDTIHISIAIGEIAPITAYDTSNVTLVRGFNITRIHDSQTGGNVLSVEASPSLPQGLVFSSLTNNDSIGGTPTAVAPWTDYTIWSNNSFGSDSSIISMRVVPAYDYGNNTLVLTRNQTMLTRTPILTGGPFSSITILPALPTGLFFEPSNGSIWGSPIMNQASTSYMVTVSNQYGTDTTAIFITVSEIPPILEYDMSDASYRRGFLSTHPVPILTGGAVATFEVHPPLPQGLTLNPATGILSGIPNIDAVSTIHTIWANNSFGSSSWSIDVEVISGIDHPSNSIQLTRNVTMSPYAPTINIVERVLSIEPDLPDGLIFDTQTAVISGTSLIPLPSTTFSIILSNSTGMDWLNFTLIVDEIAPHVMYSRTNSTFYTGFGFEPLSPEGDAGYPEIWAWNGSAVPGVHLSMFNSTQTFSSSGSNICTITSDYRAVCWGANDMGQLGQGNTNIINAMVNITLLSLEEPVDIAVGEHHTCVVTSDGTIECWGQNDFGQLGRGFKCPYGSYANGCNGDFAVTLPGLVTNSSEFGFVQVSVGDTHTCGLLANGTAMCWGSNADGQLGVGNTVDRFVPTFTVMPESASFTQIDLGKAHSCATNYSGELFCWGRNSFGQLGDGTINNRMMPTMASLPTGFSVMSVSAGGDHSCVVFNGSQPACWGRNAQGQLGDGTLLGKLEPRLISNTAWSGVSSITAGEEQTCAVTLVGEVWCWGQSRVGMFSQTTSIVTSPVQVDTQNSIGASSVAVGEQHICISTIRWTMMCTGDNQAGQIPWMNTSVVSEFVEYTGMLVHVDHAFAGTIYGAPSGSSGSIILEMSITNSAGTQYVQHTIQVQNSYSYSTSFIESIRGQVLTPVIPTLSGIGNGQFTVSPSLPNGLLLDMATGKITGTPVVNSIQKSYEITFANPYGAVPYQVVLVAYEPVADIVYSNTEIEITRAGGFIEYAPTVSNGVVSQWSIVPMLPDGLSFVDGVISGQALNNQSTTMYRIYGNNSGGVTFVDINITIFEPSPDFIALQSSYVINRGQALSPIEIGNIGGNIFSWTITPQLPDGLVFVNGQISGTPTVNMSSIVFTVKGENTGGFDEINFTLQVLEPAPLIDSTSESTMGIRNNSIQPLTLVNSGGMASDWSILPLLPNGLIFENGTIYGTPLANSTSELFTVTASNEGGSSQFSFYIEVLEPEPQFSLSTSNFLLYRGVAFNTIEVTSTGGNIASFIISPPLPSGMFFDEKRGMIQGVPLIVSPEIQYTVTAQNSGGSYQQLLTIQVLNQGPIFTLPFEAISLTEQVAMAKFAPFLSSDVVVDAWSLEFVQGEKLPEGLVFDSTTGSIFGRPAEVSPLMNITLNATNDGGIYSLSFTLKVLSDYDGDTIPDELDEDDDNDGYSDKEEELKNSDPFDSGSNPIEGFEVIIPNTEISLGAWDIIGMMTGIPLILFLSFSLLTRNKRTARFLEQLDSAKSRKDIAAVAESYENAIKWRLIGPHQGMRLERIRAEADDILEEVERQFKYKVDDQYRQLEPKKDETKAQFFDKVDQTPLVERSEESGQSEKPDDEKHKEDETSEDEQFKESEESEKPDDAPPSTDTEPTLIDENGRQWFHDEEKRYWWRDQSHQAWELLDSGDEEHASPEESNSG
ncbi:putative Ig domain-containing protein [Euryarchaeota archaeon]|nr:putative Ig domain-containing protein [Euryarchaeota archaeon]